MQNGDWRRWPSIRIHWRTSEDLASAGDLIRVNFISFLYFIFWHKDHCLTGEMTNADGERDCCVRKWRCWEGAWRRYKSGWVINRRAGPNGELSREFLMNGRKVAVLIPVW
jgi:hypothetical protein